MYIAVTGSKNNKDVYIYQSFRKENGKSSSRIYKKLGKYNTLLEHFDGDKDKLITWAKEQAAVETELYKQDAEKATVVDSFHVIQWITRSIDNYIALNGLIT